MRAGMAAGLLLGVAMPATAAPIYTHKAGVTAKALGVDETACVADAQKAARDPSFRQPYMHNPATEGSVAGAAGAGFARGMAEGLARAKRLNTTLFDCFTGRGYTFHRVSDADWKLLKKRPEIERKAQLSAWRATPAAPHPALSRDDID